MLERAITAIGLEKPIFLKNCFKRKIFEISTENSTDCLLNEYQMFSCREKVNITEQIIFNKHSISNGQAKWKLDRSAIRKHHFYFIFFNIKFIFAEKIVTSFSNLKNCIGGESYKCHFVLILNGKA